MSKPKKVGFFREIFPGEQKLPSMVPLLGPTPQSDEDLILAHLRAGRCTSASGGVMSDAFDPTKRFASPAILTDGVWEWPSTLIYYIERYHCRLPDDFVAHVRRAPK
jgi:hypothetical protein